jgi:hypothetical protein
MDGIRLTTQQALLYVALINGAIGLVIGLVPLILGIVRKKVRIGLYGLLASTIGGALLGLLLSIPAAVIFVWLILKKPVSPGGESHDPLDAAFDKDAR